MTDRERERERGREREQKMNSWDGCKKDHREKASDGNAEKRT